MNKDVIYIEPEDDITDIITKIENSKSKIIALVPPKKASVFRSVVNIKLISKAAASAEKTVVLVTTDPPIIKLAAATKIPVAKNLQSAPSIPKLEDNDERITTEEVRESSDEPEDKTTQEEEIDEGEDEDEPDILDKEEKAENLEKPAKEKKLAIKKSGNKFISWFNDHRKKAIVLGALLGVLIIVLIWALLIAPAATLVVGIKTNVNNFSEAVSFTTKFEEEDADTGKFYLEEKKLETIKKVEFEATGQKNIGEKAKGDLVIYAYFKVSGSIQIKSGTKFSLDSLAFVANEDATLSWDGKNMDSCGNSSNPIAFINSGCLVSGRIKVIATEPGSKYNISANNTGWSTPANVAVYSDKAMSGGTDEIIKVVSKEDIEKAKTELEDSDQVENKEKLFSEVGDNMMIIEASFSQTTEDAISNPAVGEKVEPDVKPTLTAKTTAKVYVIDETKVKEFIAEKAKLGENQKIYEIKNPFIENFMKTDGGFSGKLKTSYTTGPNVTENSVIETVKGKGLGQAQHDLRDINGIISVTINPSFPWVTSIPNDSNKITVILEIKD